MIELRGLGLRRRGQRLIRDITLRVERGSITGVIGPPQSGKTTLLRALAGLDVPDEGVIQVDSERLDLNDDDARERWQQHLGMAFQHDALFDSLTVFDNAALPLVHRGVEPGAVDTRVRQSLRDVGLGGTEHKLPHELSGGMQKRLGIARATVHRPSLGLFDDPVAGLDPLSASRIMALIAELVRRDNMAAVVVSHNLPVMLPACQQVLMLLEGQAVYCGAPDALGASPHPAVRQFVSGSDQGPL